MTTIKYCEHAYLGELTDVGKDQPSKLLQNGKTYTLPLLQLNNTRSFGAFPGELHPILLIQQSTLASLEVAMNEPVTSEIHRLIAIHLHYTHTDAGCTAEIIKISNDHKRCIARVLQRVHLSDFHDSIAMNLGSNPTFRSNCNVTILEDHLEKLPSILLNGLGSFPGIIYRRGNEHALIYRAIHALQSKCPHIKFDDSNASNDDPIALSYWLLSHLPVSISKTHKVFEKGDFLARIEAILDIIENLENISCSECGNIVAEYSDFIQFPGNERCDGNIVRIFSNPSGEAFDVYPFRRLRPGQIPVTLPQKEFSWFPGYRWQPMVCGECYQGTIGWKFTAHRFDDDDDENDMDEELGREHVMGRSFYAVVVNNPI